MNHLEFPKLSGIYRIFNSVNNKSYVGSAVNLRRRIYEHGRELRMGTHFNTHLQSSWNQYGESAFIVTILELCPKEMLFARESFHIDNLSSNDKNKGYNLELCRATTLGYKHTNEARNKIKEARSRQVFPENCHKKIVKSILENNPNHYREAANKLWADLKSRGESLKRNNDSYRTPEFKNKIAAISKRLARERSIPFICVETNKRYQTTQDAAQELGTTYKSVWRVLKGQRQTIKGFRFKYLGKES